MVSTEMHERAFAAYGLDAPDDRRHTAFAEPLDQADLPGRRRVRPAAEFGGEVADLDHTHALAVFFAEQRHRLVFVDGGFDRDIFNHLDLLVFKHLFINDVLDIL